jgi:hypothetical protein
MRARPLWLLLSLAALAAAPLAAPAALYKWVDDRGVVNYGDTPPPGAKQVTQLDESASTLSVVPGIPKEELDRLRERETQARVERLERELDELRARAAAAAPVEPTRQVTSTDAYPQPVVVVRPLPPRRAPHLPVRGTPVRKTPPFAAMTLER